MQRLSERSGLSELSGPASSTWKLPTAPARLLDYGIGHIDDAGRLTFERLRDALSLEELLAAAR